MDKYGVNRTQSNKFAFVCSLAPLKSFFDPQHFRNREPHPSMQNVIKVSFFHDKHMINHQKKKILYKSYIICNTNPSSSPDSSSSSSSPFDHVNSETKTKMTAYHTEGLQVSTKYVSDDAEGSQMSENFVSDNPFSPKTTTESKNALFINSLVFQSILALIGLTGCYFTHLPVLGTGFELSYQNLLEGVLYSIPFCVIGLVLDQIDYKPLIEMSEATADVVNKVFQGDKNVLKILAFSGAAGVGEEILFRALIMQLLSQFLGVVGGLIGSSLIFGLGHAVSLSYFLATTFGGLYFGWIFLHSNLNLVQPIVAHWVYDFVAVFSILFFPASQKLKLGINAEEKDKNQK